MTCLTREDFTANNINDMQLRTVHANMFTEQAGRYVVKGSF